ncbi:MAG: adenylyltransferase/cytidyltransferase family protein [Chloroflexota bacterium]
MSRRELARRSSELRSAGGRLVLTNGCFDLLHVGHIRYLQQARQLGDALAVGINSDASVRRIKGPGRPVTPQDERAEIVAALECVDFVCLFDEETAADLVAEIRPAVYAKGGDYSSRQDDENFPVEGHVAHAYGGEVRILDLVPGHSTSALLELLD